MAEIIRRCPDCGLDRPFQQHQGAADWCADADDRYSPDWPSADRHCPEWYCPEWYCPEWYCVACGAALLIGDIPIVIEPVSSASRRDRVA